MVNYYSYKNLSSIKQKNTKEEYFLATATIILNSVVTFAGLILWRNNIIVFSDNSITGIIIDFFALLFIMDFLMYVFHRFAHNKYVFPLIHKLHHKYETPNTLILFILNPIEALGFGMLFLITLSLIKFSLFGVILYTIVNVIFGVIAHIGVEPFKKTFIELPIIKYISTSTFHFQHHFFKECNYGFYTTIWDKLFNTIKNDYEEVFMEISEKNP